VLTRDYSNAVWKRNKNLLYLGSVHGGELPEMYGITGDHLGTDAIGMSTFIHLLLVLVTDNGFDSQFHQPPRPQLFKGFYSREFIVKHHLASIHTRQQEDVLVQ